MSASPDRAIEVLERRFALDYPREAAQQLERMGIDAAAALLARLPVHAVVRVWQSLATDVAALLLTHLPAATVTRLLSEAEPAVAANTVAQFEPDLRERMLGLVDGAIGSEIREMLEYPHGVAGRLMDPRVVPLRRDLSVGEALARLRTMAARGLRELFVVDDDGGLSARVEIQDLATADPDSPLRDVIRPLVAVVGTLDPREDVVDVLQAHAISEIPVIDVGGRFVGVIHQAALLAAVEQESSVDIQTMVGASREERALSSPGFAVLKRLPWLQINLLTAFVAAAVVGLFEDTISRFTALAVLLPVVAGQSGNAGAQALAVTMRGLVLREVTLRHWHRIVGKEALVGLANGLAVAATTSVGVWLWSRSTGLVLVCASAMLISMVVAGLAGALVPVLLRRFGQDPAQSSSIILTTVTDVVGFFSFLGIATLLAGLLEATG